MIPYCIVLTGKDYYTMVRYNTVQYSMIPYCIVLTGKDYYTIVQYGTIQYSTVQYDTIQYNSYRKRIFIVFEYKAVNYMVSFI